MEEEHSIEWYEEQVEGFSENLQEIAKWILQVKTFFSENPEIEKKFKEFRVESFEKKQKEKKQLNKEALELAETITEEELQDSEILRDFMQLYFPKGLKN